MANAEKNLTPEEIVRNDCAQERFSGSATTADYERLKEQFEASCKGQFQGIETNRESE